MKNAPAALSRRRFLGSLAATATLAALPASLKAKSSAAKPIPLGFDNFAVRAWNWKAPQLLDYAAELKVDTLFISDLEAIGSLENPPLLDVKKKADDLGIALYVGSWSICPSSTRFRDTWGTAEEHLLTGIRVSKTLGSPVFRVVLGAMEDRQTPGGIKARIADTVKVLTACRAQAIDAGVKIAVENHAGDMHSWELAELVESAGKDFVGVNIDSGNAAWTLEDPVDVLERLGPYTICSSLRDNMIWKSKDGATVQWTPVGEGVVDWQKFIALWRKYCPSTPFQIETISGFSKAFHFEKAEFWEHYDKRPEALAHFVALAERGKEIPPFRAPEGSDRTRAEQEYQKSELEKSIRYCRETLKLGLKS